jgi:uncharacterized protein YndB with AHSA1/START domain
MPVGKTKSAGWQIGVSRTVPRSVEHVWRVITSPAGTATWLGRGVRLPAEPGTPYQTADGTVGEIRSYWPDDRIRLTWHPPGWDRPSIVQVTVSGKADEKAVLRFHQEQLAGADERERQRRHWAAVLDRLQCQVVD